MATYEAFGFWIALVIYALAGGGYIYAFVFRNTPFLSKLTVLLTVGLLFHTAAITARVAAQGHFPWATDYENGLMGGWFIIGSAIFVGWRQKQLRVLGAGAVPAALLIMGYGVMRNPTLAPMAATLKSFWLSIHVFFAWLSFGAYALAMAAGIFYLLKDRPRKSEADAEFYDRLPSLARLDELMFRYIAFGFLTNSVMIAAGSIWAKDLWGAYWSWDPIETWSLISWLGYGVVLHLRLTMGWRDRRFAWLSVISLSTVIINFFGVTLFVKSAVHVFQMR